MRILYVAYRYDYGHQDRGPSFEHSNFYESLVAMGHDIDYFDTGTLLAGLGRDAMNAELARRAMATTPDLLFACLTNDELDPDVVSGITSSGIPTFNWFCDDHWRFESFTQRWAPCFTSVSTTAASALPKYAAIGYDSVIKTQWAAADSLYRRRGLPLRYDVTFVGQCYGDRPETLQRLREAGLDVQRWGTGWDVRFADRVIARLPVIGASGGRDRLERIRARTRCSQESMLEIFEQSRLNLNLVEASQGGEPQIKGRTFEVPACGGFLLDGRTEGIEEYFEPGVEIALYDDAEDMVAQAKHYLGHEAERARVAAAGHRRTHAEHTYRARFAAIFRTMGVS